jgi:hypothetical protein
MASCANKMVVSFSLQEMYMHGIYTLMKVFVAAITTIVNHCKSNVVELWETRWVNKKGYFTFCHIIRPTHYMSLKHLNDKTKGAWCSRPTTSTQGKIPCGFCIGQSFPLDQILRYLLIILCPCSVSKYSLHLSSANKYVIHSHNSFLGAAPEYQILSQVISPQDRLALWKLNVKTY